MTIQPTRLLYLRDGSQLSGQSTILLKESIPNTNKISIVLDKTYFYPQGGGQPSDIGTINHCYKVEHVRMDPSSDIVYHDCIHSDPDCQSSNCNVGSVISYKIDNKTRDLHCRLHSAGHLIDLVLFDVMGWGNILTVSKAYHFPQGPSVEYTGDASSIIPTGNPAAKQSLIKKLEQHCQELIEKDYPTIITFDSNEEYLSDRVTPNDKATRWIQFCSVINGKFEGFDRKIACGGTHVKSLKHIGKIIIRKLEYKSGTKTLRVGYDVTD